MAEKNPKLEKSLELINKKGLDGLIIYSGGTCSISGAELFDLFL